VSNDIPVREVVDGGRTVDLVKSMYEVRTDDGTPLIITHKRPQRNRRPRRPVMLVHGLGQNRFSWHLSGRSMENYLVSHGFPTYNVELRGHGLSRAAGSEAPENFEAYVRYDLPACVKFAKRHAGADRVFYMGHSLGGIISYCFGPESQEDLAGIVSIAGPFTFGMGNPVMRPLAFLGKMFGDHTPILKVLPHYFYVDVIGMAVKAGLFYLDSSKGLFPLRVWLPGSTRRDILEERIRLGFDRTSTAVFSLLVRWAATGQFISTDESFDYSQGIEKLDVPILFVVGDRDDVVPPQSVIEGYERAQSRDKTFKYFGPPESLVSYGHCDLICGDHAPDEVWPYILGWLEERDAPAPGRPRPGGLRAQSGR